MPTEVASVSPRRTPEAFLRAEVAAFPLASEASFRLHLTSLDPALQGKTKDLWRACEQRLAEHAGWSLDRLVSVRDEMWFGERAPRSGEAAGEMRLHEYLTSLANAHLERRGGVTRVAERPGETTLDAEGHHRWLTFALPEDLLLVALGVRPTPRRVDAGTPLLTRRLLDLGVAEIHQHLGAGIDFPLLWTSAIGALAIGNVEEGALTSAGAPLSDGKEMIRWLTCAMIARAALSEHLLRDGKMSFKDRLDAITDPSKGVWSYKDRSTLRGALLALASGDDAALPRFLDLRDLYQSLHPNARSLRDDPPRRLEEVEARCDPLASRLDLGERGAGERKLVEMALDYIASAEGGEDTHFASIFWQYERVRIQYYRAIVERPLTAGLQWFIRFYNRIEKLRAPLDAVAPEAAFFVAGEDHPIAALEARMSLKRSPFDFANGVLSASRSWRAVVERTGNLPSEPEFGILYHFVKDRDAKQRWARGEPPAFWAGTYAEPGTKDLVNARYLEALLDGQKKARALAAFIERVPSALWLVRGLDVASDELSVPTWVLVPWFQTPLVASERAQARPGVGPPLRVTAHVGEDYRHLMEGLRHTYEVVHYILGRAGGRLGHAVALGVEPRGWAESAGAVTMPAEERLWDAVMEWRLYTRYQVPPEMAADAPPGRIQYLDNTVRELSELVFLHAEEPQVLAEAHHRLHQIFTPDKVSGLDTVRRALSTMPQGTLHPRRVARLLRHYLMDERLFRRGQTPVTVPADDGEVRALDAVQRALRRGVALRGVVVEVNPSSNLLVGDLLDLRHHPILRLCPPEPIDDLPPVPIAVGSDDPVVFSTRLIHEYALLHRTARAAGYAERVVQTWLDDVRRTGMDARFTVALRPSAEKVCKDIERDLERFLSLPQAS